MTGKPIVVFDGVCKFCNYWVNFAIRRDKKKKLLFAAVQGKVAQQLLANHPQDPEHPDSVILLDNGKIYTESSAALRICKYLDGGWKLCSVFLIVPRFIRDFFYRLVARNRYRIFGKRETCMIPPANWKERFLE